MGLAANLIALPLICVALSHWLASFAYRVDLTPGVFAAGGILAVAVVMVAVWGQSLKAVTESPVQSLRQDG